MNARFKLGGVLGGIATALLGGCASPRAAFHPTATSAVLHVGSAEHEGAFQRDRWHQGLETDRLRGAVLRIVVDRDGSITDGSGIAVCQVGDDLFILTARHVPEPPGSGRRKVAKSQTYRFEMASSALPPIVVGADEELWMKHPGDLDVAIVRVAVANDTVRVPPVSFGRSSTLASGATVRTFGYASASGRSWEEVTGRVVSDAGDHAYAPAVEEGFSGGPVFDADGRLVGINVSTQSDRTRFVPIETAVTAIDRWLPPECPRPA